MEALFFFHLAVLLLAIVAYKLLSRKKHNYPPGPRALPVVGHLHLIKAPRYLYFETFSNRLGPILLFWMGKVPLVVVSSPSAVDECFNKNDIIFAGRPKSMYGDHHTYNYTFLVWAPYGPLWKNLRRLTYTEIFSLKALHRSVFVREEEIRHLVGRLLRCSAGGDKPKVDMKYMFIMLTVNVIMRVAAGKRHVLVPEEDTEEEKRLLNEFKSLFFPGTPVSLCDFIPVLRLIGYKGMEKGMIRLAKKKDVFLDNLVAEVRAKRAASGKMSSREEGDKLSSVIDTFLDLKETDPEFYTDKIIKGIVMMAFNAGTETTSTTLEWGLTLLMQNPEKILRLQAEIDSVVGDNRFLNESDIAKLPYLKAVVKETLRMYPPIPLMVPHLSRKACTIGGYEIPNGAMLMVNAWTMHRDPKLWTDPDEFRPERFEEESECEGYMYVPFGVGRRACPGYTMGTYMVSMGLGMLMQCFDWDKIGMDEDMSHVVGRNSLSKNKPLEASFAPRPKMTKLLNSLLF